MTAILKSGILRILQSNGCREEAECFLSMMRNEVKNRKALEGAVAAMKGVMPIVDCDCPDHPADDFVGWQGSENIPVTFGQVRAYKEAIAAGEEALK